MSGTEAPLSGPNPKPVAGSALHPPESWCHRVPTLGHRDSDVPVFVGRIGICAADT